jgi:hypothetical protein
MIIFDDELWYCGICNFELRNSFWREFACRYSNISRKKHGEDIFPTVVITTYVLLSKSQQSATLILAY